MICPKAKGCEVIECHHKVEHEKDERCNDDVCGHKNLYPYLKGVKCVSRVKA